MSSAPVTPFRACATWDRWTPRRPVLMTPPVGRPLRWDALLARKRWRMSSHILREAEPALSPEPCSLLTGAQARVICEPCNCEGLRGKRAQVGCDRVPRGGADKDR